MAIATLALPQFRLSATSPWCLERDYISMAGCSSSRSVCFVRAQHCFEGHISPDPISDRRIKIEKLWREFFSDPSQWWDHRPEKLNRRYPDFKHKRTGQSLWLHNSLTPPWVEAELATMAPGLLQSHNFSWNVRLTRHLQAEDYKTTLNLFQQMQLEGIMPDTFTFVAVLNACSNLKYLEEGRSVHKQIIQRGSESDVYVATCLVDMYAKCGSIEEARNVFNKMRERDVVSWNAMLAGYVKAEQGLKALEIFRKMQQEGVEPDAVTFIGALNACASVAALEEGSYVHKEIIQRRYESDVYVTTCLIDMYSKCGSIEDAWIVFNKMRKRNVVSWNAMIEGYAMHGHSKKAIALFKRMGKEGVGTDRITFTCLLSACSHGRLVKEGLRYFNTITSHYAVFLTREHYACMVDLLGRAGRLEEAEEMVKRMPMERNSCVWMSLLGACRIHGNIEMAERAAKRCLELDPNDASVHVLLSNIYADLGEGDPRRVGASAAIGKQKYGQTEVTYLDEVNNVG